MAQAPNEASVLVDLHARGWQFLRESAELTPSRKHSVQIARSVVVSVVALAVDFSTLVFTKEVLGFYYLVAATVGFTLGVIVNYILSNKWVFAHRQHASRTKEFSIFVAICLVGLVLNLLIIALFVEKAGLDYRIAKVFSTVVVFFWNFAGRKKLLY
jgi:putative flippase GtrA